MEKKPARAELFQVSYPIKPFGLLELLEPLKPVSHRVFLRTEVIFSEFHDIHICTFYTLKRYVRLLEAEIFVDKNCVSWIGNWDFSI